MSRLYSARRFLDRCSLDWQPVARMAYPDPERGARQIRMLQAEGDDALIELDGRGNVRLTDAGILAVMEQSPGYTDLYDRSSA